MMTAFDTGTVQDGTVRGVLVNELALENAAVFKRQVEDVPVSRVGHRIQPNDSRLALPVLNEVAHASEIAMAAIQTPHAPDRLPVRRQRHTRWRMQGAHLRSGRCTSYCSADSRPISQSVQERAIFSGLWIAQSNADCRLNLCRCEQAYENPDHLPLVHCQARRRSSIGLPYFQTAAVPCHRP
jgi:hypothetical protein